MRLILYAGGWGGGGFSKRIAWRSDLMWKMSLRMTNRLHTGVKLGGKDLRGIHI